MQQGFGACNDVARATSVAQLSLVLASATANQQFSFCFIVQFASTRYIFSGEKYISKQRTNWHEW